MGCDIHLYCERKNKNGKWVSADIFSVVEDDDGLISYHIKELYNGRNYTLFGILADVRNSDDNEPISQPRGLPDDICNITKLMKEEWKYDGHSYSYLLAKELFDWEKSHPTTKFKGMLSPQQIEDLENNKYPKYWCKWTNQKGYEERIWVENESPISFLNSLIKQRMKEEFYIFNEEDYDKYGNDFRIVFWFDN